MTLEEIEKLVNSRKYEHRIILYQDNGEDVDIEGYFHWLIEEVKKWKQSCQRLQFQKIELLHHYRNQGDKRAESQVKWLISEVKRLREGIGKHKAVKDRGYVSLHGIDVELYKLLEEK